MSISTPKVSIIILSHKSKHFTDDCERSIKKNTVNVPYQIHVAGEDVNGYAEKKWDELRDSKYLVFLRNDTIVRNNWLSPLVELMERDPSFGMAGPKFINPDGTLYQAGGVIWSNGERLNYGQGDHADRSKYNYVKEVDFICGACFIIRNEIWSKAGGHDTRFTLSSYQAIDLAFKVRKQGFKVMYQPNSVVKYHRASAAGNSTTQPFSPRQEIFIKEWKETLKTEQMDLHRDTFWARDRSRHKKTILVIGLEGPAFDKSTANRMTYHYLKLFSSMGLHVIYSGYFIRLEPYASILEQAGIQVLYEQNSKKTLEKWIKKNGKYINYAYLIFPFIAEQYMAKLRKNTTAKIIYNASDLFYLRERRNYELTRDDKLLESSQSWKDREFKLFNTVDSIHVVSAFEKKILAAACPGKNIRHIPVYVYEQNKHLSVTPFDDRTNLMFVGAYTHPPNIDGVVWFIRKIFPKVVQKFPKVKFYIIGSNPTAEIKALQSDNIRIIGYVPDNQLDQYYSKCRLVVAPLRFGAGVKGKIVEALYYRIPVVTTTIGAEGMPHIDSCIAIADKADDFANEVINLYSNEDRWSKMSAASERYIERYFSISAAKKQLEKDITP